MNAMLDYTEAKIIERLEEWKQDGIELPAVFDAYRRLLQLQVAARARLRPPLLDDVQAFRRLSGGLPAVAFSDLDIDWALVRGLLEAAGPILAEQASLPAAEAKALGALIADASLLEDLARAWFEGSTLAPIAATYSIDEGLLSATLGAALKPTLLTHRDAILPSLDQELWRHRTCPVCGGLPDLAHLEREIRNRWLMCSRCDACWLFHRLQCPYCDNTDHQSLAYYTDDEESFRLYVCDKCRHYIKAIDLNQAQGEVLLPLERLLTVSLDDEALATGYTPGVHLWPPPVATPGEDANP